MINIIKATMFFFWNLDHWLWIMVRRRNKSLQFEAIPQSSSFFYPRQTHCCIFSLLSHCGNRKFVFPGDSGLGPAAEGFNLLANKKWIHQISTSWQSYLEYFLFRETLHTSYLTFSDKSWFQMTEELHLNIKSRKSNIHIDKSLLYLEIH